MTEKEYRLYFPGFQVHEEQVEQELTALGKDGWLVICQYNFPGRVTPGLILMREYGD